MAAIVVNWLSGLSLISFVTLLLTYLYYKFIYLPFTYFKKLGIPHPRPTIFFGNALDFAKYGFYDTYLMYCRKYGKIYGLLHGCNPEIVVSDLDIIKEITVKHFDNFVNRIDLLKLPKTSPMIHGLLQLRDDAWKRVRNVIVPTFSGAKMRKITPIINECSENLLDEFLTANRCKGEVDVWRYYGNLTMQVILATAFGVETEKKGSSSLTNAAKGCFSSASLLLVLLPLLPHFIVRALFMWRKKQHGDNITYLAEAARQVIESRRRQGKSARKDLLQLMIDASEDGKLSEDEITAQSVVFLMAGYETTSSTLAFTSYLLALNPHIQDRLIAEIDEKCPDASGLNYDNIGNLSYLDMVLEESLRIYSPAFRFNREVKEDITINGVFFPKKVCVTIPTMFIHHDPELWPNPEVFDPERFTPEAKAKRNQYSYMPFGIGPRSCVGMRLALVEAKLVLARILQHVRFTVVKETPHPPLPPGGGIVFTPNCKIILGIAVR